MINVNLSSTQLRQLLEAFNSSLASADNKNVTKTEENTPNLNSESDSVQLNSSNQEAQTSASTFEQVCADNNVDMAELQMLIEAGLVEGFATYLGVDYKSIVGEDGKGAGTEETTVDAPAVEDVADDVASTDTTSATKSTSSTTATDAIPDGEESSKIQEEIDELEDEKDANYKEMEEIEKKIEDLTQRAEQNILRAAEAQEAKVKENEEKTQQAVEENIAAYVAANKEGGKGMSRSELQGNIKASLEDVPEVGDAVSAAVAANDQLNLIDSHLSDLNKLIADTKDIESKIESKTKQYDAAKESEKEAAEKAKSCDPIGFTMGEGEDQVRYDFIVDDGEFDSTSDFLGAEGQWADMEALDTDGDKVVTAAELEAAKIQAVKTNADGSQEVVSIAEEFGEDFSIDLGSYTQGGSHAAIDSTTDTDADGTVDQELLGTFNMNVNGQTIQGYNTLDDTEWLEENYGLTTATKDASEAQTTTDSYSMELKAHADFFKTYTQKVQDLREQLKETWVNIGLTEDSLKELNGEAVDKAGEAAEEQVEEQAEVGNSAASEEATEAAEETTTETTAEETAEEVAADDIVDTELTEEEIELFEKENFLMVA